MTNNNKKLSVDKNKILDYATDKFMREGFYKNSMDSVASGLRISKKTIYKYFPSKEELVRAIAQRFILEISKKIESVIEMNESSLIKALHLLGVMRMVTTKLSDTWVRDIQIHMPELWERIDEFRTKRAYAVLGKIIEQGQTEGMIIDNPPELIIHLFVTALRSIVNPEYLYYQKMNYRDAIQHTFEILFNGILTNKGKKEFNKSFKKVIENENL